MALVRPKKQIHPVISEDLESIAATALPWEELAGCTVLITGASGFLPAYLVETLLWLNSTGRVSPPCRVVALVRSREKATRRFAPYLGREDLELLVRDVCQPLELPGPVHYLIHAASQASPRFYGCDPVGTLSANVIGTYRLLELAHAKKSRRFLFFSSAEVYGALAQERAEEQQYGYLNPLEVRSCYAESKRMGENMAVSWHSQYGVPALIVRPFHTYGPGMDLCDGRVFADFVADVVAGRDIVMRSDGSAVRAFCYLAEATAGFFTVLFKGEVGLAYNVGNDRAESSIGQLAELLVSLYPEKGLRVRRQAPPSPGYLKSQVSRIVPDIARARALGWEPVVGLTEGFKKTIRSFEPWE